MINYNETDVIPKNAAIHATNLPERLKGNLSPYPTVVIVAMHHQIASEMDYIFYSSSISLFSLYSK